MKKLFAGLKTGIFSWYIKADKRIGCDSCLGSERVLHELFLWWVYPKILKLSIDGVVVNEVSLMINKKWTSGEGNMERLKTQKNSNNSSWVIPPKPLESTQKNTHQISDLFLQRIHKFSSIFYYFIIFCNFFYYILFEKKNADYYSTIEL